MKLLTLIPPRLAVWGACGLVAVYGGAIFGFSQTATSQARAAAIQQQGGGDASAGPSSDEEGALGFRTPPEIQSPRRFTEGRSAVSIGYPYHGFDLAGPSGFESQDRGFEQKLMQSLDVLAQSSGEEKKELKDTIAAMLQQQFDVMLVKREESLVQLEERVKKLRSELEKQKEQKDKVVDAILVLAENSVSARGAVQSLLRGWQGNVYGTFYSNAVPGGLAPYAPTNRFPEDFRSLPARIAPQGSGGDNATEQLRGRLLPNEITLGGNTGGGGLGFNPFSDAKGSDR